MRGIAVASVLLLLMIAQNWVARADIYPYKPPPKDGMGEAHTVFAGILLSAEVDPENQYIASRTFPSAYSFLVTQIWRGVPSDTIVVQMRGMGANAGVGGHYLVHAVAYDSGLYTVGHGVRLFEQALWYRYWLPEPIASRDDLALPRMTVAGLLDSLASADSSVRYYAAYTLAHIETTRQRGLGYFIDVIEGNRPGNPWAAQTPLRDLGPDARSAVPALIQVWETGDKRDRKHVLQTLGLVQEPDDFCDLLISALADGAVSIRTTACHQAMHRASAMSSERRRMVADKLVAVLADPEEGVRKSAAHALRRFDEDAGYVLTALRPFAQSEEDVYVQVAIDSTITVLEGFAEKNR